MADSIAVRQLKTLADELEAEGTTLQTEMQHAGLEPVDTDDAIARIDWADFHAIFEIFGARWDPAKLSDLGAKNLRSDDAVPFRAGLFLEYDNVVDMIRDVCGPGGAYAFILPIMEFSLRQTGRLSFVMTATMRSGFASSVPHHHYGLGFLRALPTILFEPQATVSLQLQEQQATYDIRLQRPKPLAQLKRRWQRSKRNPLFMRMTRENFGMLAERQVRLQAESARRLEVESKLAHVEKMDALGKLTGGIAHDFNNLLSVVVGQLDMLQAELADPTQQHRAREAMAAAQRGAALTQQLLTFGRQSRLQPVELDANQAIEFLLRLLQVTIGETIEVRFHPASEPCVISADRNQLENALLNLAINARDAMPDGGHLNIEVRSEHLDEGFMQTHALTLAPGSYVAIAMSDDGIGLDKKTLERVFEPFFTTKDAGQGTGLGLSMVWGFVQQSLGYAEISSLPGDGTVVTIYLPQIAAVVDVEPDPSDVEDTLPFAHSIKILVVEDQSVVRHVVQDMLDVLGARVVICKDGDAALTALAADQYDLLLSDVLLPGGMLGTEVVTRALKIQPDLKTAFMSGHMQMPPGAEHATIDRDNLLYKPFTIATLRRFVTRTMTG